MPNGLPDPPTNFRVTGIGAFTASISFGPADGLGHKILEYAAFVVSRNEWPGTGVPIIYQHGANGQARNLSPNTTYYATARARSEMGWGEWVPMVAFTTYPVFWFKDTGGWKKANAIWVKRGTNQKWERKRLWVKRGTGKWELL